MRHQAALTIPIAVTRDLDQPMYEQIANQVGAAVEGGLLARHSRLPSTRNLAALLGVSRGVTEAAYDLLFTRGLLASHPGSGTYVAAGAEPHRTREHRGADDRSGPGRGAGRAEPDRSDRPLRIDLRPGQRSPEAFPLAAWRAAWRQASLRRPPVHALPPLGLPGLRRAIAEHVWRTRGISLAGKEVVVTGGTAHGVRILLDALGLHGRRIAIEEPAPLALHRAAGSQTDPPAALAVDAAGAIVDRVPAACRAIVVSADAHLPTGRIMSLGRRHAAADWAARTGGHLIEIACDAVFRPEASRLPRLSTLAGPRCVLVGSFCELLTPTLKLGYAIVPRMWAGEIRRRLGEHAEQPPYVTQLAVASLLADGTVVRLMHRLSRLYANKRALVNTALAPLRGQPGGPDTVGVDVIDLPATADPARVAGYLLDQGIRVETLAPYHFSERPAPPALVLGYAHLPEPALHRGLSLLTTGLRRFLPG
jgi:GntR family transcriptional regulator/MocR family aminotransferase